jgi:4-amino-4-deoxy-L-arabinose transferase-like glycosyltransferase
MSRFIPSRSAVFDAWTDDRDSRPRPVVLLLATGLAAVLRLLSLGDHPLWIDELLTWQFLRPTSGSGFWEQFNDVYQSPLTIATLWPLTRDACSEFMMRLPSAVFGIAVVPIGGYLGAAFGGRRTGEWSALLLAVSPFAIWYSQEARGYAALILLATAASLVLTKMMRDGPRASTALLYGLLAGTASLANNSAVFLVAAHAVVVLVTAFPQRGSAWGWWCLAFGLAAAIPMPWLLRAAGILAVDRLAPGAGTGEALREGSTFSPWAWPFAFQSLVYGFSLGPSLAELHQPDRLRHVLRAAPLLGPAALAAAILFLAGLARLRRPRAVAATLWLVIPLLAVTALALRNVKTFNPRYLAACAPLVLLVIAHGAVTLRRGRWLALVLLAFFAFSLVGYYGIERYAREDLRSAAEAVAAEATAEDVLLVPVVSSLFRHYYEGEGTIKEFWDCPKIRTRDEAVTALRLRSAGARRAWLVLSRSWDLDPHGHLEPAGTGLGEVVVRFEAPGVKVVGLRLPGGAVTTPGIDRE